MSVPIPRPFARRAPLLRRPGGPSGSNRPSALSRKEVQLQGSKDVARAYPRAYLGE